MLGYGTLGERVYKEIKKFIIDGHYSPGQRLMYEEVSTELGVSQTPVKDAFMRLEREGLVETIARRGTFVKSFTKKELREYLELRLTLEVFALENASKKITPEDIREMKEINERMLDNVIKRKNEEIIATDAEFHIYLSVASKNEKLMVLMNMMPLTNLFSLAGRGAFFIEHGEIYYQEHKDIIEAVESRNVKKAKSLLTKHLLTGKKNTLLLDFDDASDA